MAGGHFIVTAVFWLAWAAICFYGARDLARSFPDSANVLGFLGTVILILPTMSNLAWDALARLGGEPRVPGQSDLPRGGYDPFTWWKLALHVVGITLIGLGFGMKYWLQGASN